MMMTMMMLMARRAVTRHRSPDQLKRRPVAAQKGRGRPAAARLGALLAVAAASAGPSSAAAAADPLAERPLSLEECIDLALRHNLDLALERRAPLIAEQQLLGSRAAYEPGLSLDAGYRSTEFPPSAGGARTSSERFGAGLNGILPSGMSYNLGASRIDLATETGAGRFLDVDGFLGLDVRQPLLRGFTIDTTRMQIALGELELRASASGLRQFLMALVTDVEFAYYDLASARDQLRIFQQSYDLAARLVESHGKQVEAGRMARLDKEQAQSRVAASDAALASARNFVSQRENALKLLLTDDFVAWVDTRIVPTTSLQPVKQERSREESWRRALGGRPEIVQSRIQLEREDIRLRFARNRVYPTLDLTAGYGLSGDDDEIRRGEGPDYAVGLVVNIPIGNGRARADLEVSRLREQQALLSYKRLEQRIMAEVVNALNALGSSAKRVASTREAREFAQTALQAEETKLANGKSTNFFVLQLQADLTQARLDHTLAIVDYNRALSILALREGSTLERHAISVLDPSGEGAEQGAGPPAAPAGQNTLE